MDLAEAADVMAGDAEPRLHAGVQPGLTELWHGPQLGREPERQQRLVDDAAHVEDVDLATVAQPAIARTGDDAGREQALVGEDGVLLGRRQEDPAHLEE